MGELAPARTIRRRPAAGFPAGTVSGAPKVRAMEIIDELEPDHAAAFTAAAWAISAQTATMDTLHRFSAPDHQGRQNLRAGGGRHCRFEQQARTRSSSNVQKGPRPFRSAAEEALRYAERHGSGNELLVIDNYDSLPYNLVHFLGELSEDLDRLS